MSRLLSIIVLATLVLVLGGGTTYSQQPKSAGAPPSSRLAGSSVGGAFSLTDDNGETVTQNSWPGKFKLVFFGFTHCSGICPTTLDKLTTALNGLGTAADKLQPLFVTTDPTRDTPDVMKTYVGNFHKSILGLTGTEAQVRQAEDAYKVYAAKVPGADAGSYEIDHSAFLYLMSPDDQLLEILSSEDSAQTVIAKIKPHLEGAAQPAVTAP